MGAWLARWRFSALDLFWICGATLLIRDDHLLLAVLLWFVGPILAEMLGARA
jgi:hypothetical protein